MSPRIEFDQRISYPNMPANLITTRVIFEPEVGFYADPFALNITIEVPKVPVVIDREQTSLRESICFTQTTGDRSEHTVLLHPPLVPIPVEEVRVFPEGGVIIDQVTGSSTATRGHTMQPNILLGKDGSVVVTAPPNQPINLLFTRAPLD